MAGWNGRRMVGPDMESPHAATRQTAQTPLAANAARPLDLIDASPVPLVAAASAGGGKTQDYASVSNARVRNMGSTARRRARLGGRNGFRNLTNYIARSLLQTRGQSPTTPRIVNKQPPILPPHRGIRVTHPGP
jgi:hypothetical protein